ncbi:MAG TPA: hypothetical protein VFQ90_01700 [Stellaceae bacterium]|jgi:hypothetical protein|nr:hypothetical protein [Stellaceae bacterium]
MIVNVGRRTGDGIVRERVDSEFFFEGGAAEAGVLATFELDGREVTGRVVRVLDAASEFTRANLPRPNEARVRR